LLAFLRYICDTVRCFTYKIRCVAVQDCGSRSLNSKIAEFGMKARSLGAASVKSAAQRGARLSKKMRDSKETPGPVLVRSVFHEKIAAFPTNAQTVRQSSGTGKILQGPIRESIVRDHDAQLAGPAGLVLNRRLQPAVRARTHHQSGLVVSMGGHREHRRLEFAIGCDSGGKKVPAVGAKTVMSALPEVGFGAGFHQQTRTGRIDLPGRWRVQPFERRMEVFPLKRLVDREGFHGAARHDRTFDHDY